MIPVVVGALGTVKKGMAENIKKVSEKATVKETQKICMLRSAQILRKVLSDDAPDACARLACVADALNLLYLRIRGPAATQAS